MKTLQLTCDCLESESRCPGGFAWSLVMLEFACFCSEPKVLDFLLGPSGMALTDNKPHNWSHLFFLTLQEPSQPSKHSPKAHTSPNPQREASPPSRKGTPAQLLFPGALCCFLSSASSLTLVVSASLPVSCLNTRSFCLFSSLHLPYAQALLWTGSSEDGELRDRLWFPQRCSGSR